MRRHAWGVIVTGVLVGAGGAIGGCNFIVGAGDYAVMADDDTGPILHAEAGKKDAGGPPQKDSGTTADAQGGLLGDPCFDNTECTRGTCGGEWCTEPCTTNGECGMNSVGQTNFCVPNTNGELICVPGCSTQSDCDNFEGTTCTMSLCTESADGSSPDGNTGGGGIVGDPCSDDAGTGCAVGTCNGSWCEAACKSTSDKSCGSNSLDELNYCVQTASGFMCFPGCSTNADCTPFPDTTCSPNTIGSTADGFSCSIPFGQIGDPCSDAEGCVADAGATMCVGSWCSAACTSLTDKSCGTSSTGQANSCVKAAGVFTCSPGCTTSDDCAPYPQTFCQPVAKGSTALACSPSGGLIADPCSQDSDCTQGTCMSNWCNEVCTQTGSASCGTDSAGMASQCLEATDSENHCFPGCLTDFDCTPYPNTTCVAAPTSGSVCSN